MTDPNLVVAFPLLPTAKLDFPGTLRRTQILPAPETHVRHFQVTPTIMRELENSVMDGNNGALNGQTEQRQRDITSKARGCRQRRRDKANKIDRAGITRLEGKSSWRIEFERDDLRSFRNATRSRGHRQCISRAWVVP